MKRTFLTAGIALILAGCTKTEDINKLQNVYLTCELLQTFAMLIGVISVILAVIEYKKKRQQAKEAHLFQLLKLFWCEDENKEILQKIDYGELHYSPEFHRSDEEGSTDRILMICEYILYLKSISGFLSDYEFAFFRYVVDRVIINNDIQDYLYNLKHWSRVRFPYGRLVDYGIGIDCINEADFNNSNYYLQKGAKYHNFLNF